MFNPDLLPNECDVSNEGYGFLEAFGRPLGSLEPSWLHFLFPNAFIEGKSRWDWLVCTPLSFHPLTFEFIKRKENTSFYLLSLELEFKFAFRHLCLTYELRI